MFASSGDGGGGDDAYNFDIANSYGGGRASKKRSKQSKLGKSSLNKTTGSTPNSSSFKAHETPSASLMPVPSMGSKAPLRASAPAAPTSALDKAMSFLNKYKEGGSSTPRTSAAEGVGAFRRSGAANTILDEDEMDMSLSSDSDKYLKTTRKSPSRLTASRENPVPERYGEDAAVTRTGGGVSRSLTGARSSTQFATARELGILDSGGLEGPKAAVSPAGLDTSKPSTGSKGNTLYGQAGVYSPPPDGRSTGVHAVSATTSASPNAGAPRQSYEYDSEGEVASSIDSVSSMVTAGVEETRGEPRAKEKEPKRMGSFSEIGGSYGSNAQRSSGVVRLSVEQESALLSSQQKDGLCSPIGEASDVESGLSWEGGTGTPRSTMPLDEFASESDHKAPPILGREAVGPDAGGNRERSASSSHDAQESEAEDDGEDDYGDDDFEEVDPLLESGGEDAGNQPLNFVASKGRGRSEESEEPGLPQTESHVLQRPQIRETREILLDNDTEHQKPEPATAISSVGASPLGVEVAHGRRHGERQESRQAWSDPPAGLKLGLRDTADFGTSPESDADGNTEDVSEIAPGGKVGTRERLLGVAEKWDRGSLKGCWMEGASGAHDSAPTKVTVDGIAQSRPGKVAWDETQDISAEKRKTGVTGIGGVSRGGVLIDRSTEVHDSGRPPGMEVKTISRSSGVASVEYAHDTDTGVDLRSYGTQAAGSSAAVQVTIAVPGMLGTETAVEAGHTTTSGTRTSGVGYKQGEPYAKWGRFACEMPGNYRSPGGGRAADGASVEFLSPRATPSRRRSRPLNESCRTGTTGLEGDGVNVRENAGGCLEDNNRGEMDQPKGYKGMHSSGPRGAPAYLQTFFAAMAKSQSDNCSAWRKALEETAPAHHGFPPPDDGKGCAEAKPPTPGTEGTEPLPFDAGGSTQGWCAGPRDFDQAIYGINTAAQDSFRKQLADLRDNLNKIRYRAEVAGRQGYAHNYESVADVREFIDKVRPRATTQAEALVTVDPSLSLEEAEAIAQESGTAPSSPVEPHPNRTRTPDRVGDS